MNDKDALTIVIRAAQKYAEQTKNRSAAAQVERAIKHLGRKDN